MTIDQKTSAKRWRLRDADRTLRLFLTAFLLLLTTGYALGLLFVDHTTSGTQQGITEQFLGTPDDTQAAELKYAKSVNEMYIFLHNHILSLALVFFALGSIFYFSSAVGDGWKAVLLVEPFVAIGTTFGGIWFMRFVSAHFSWLVMISGVSMVICYATMVILILKELWSRR